MDYVPAHGDPNKKDDRDEVGGCRAFDGEDQGKSRSPKLFSVTRLRTFLM